MHHTMIIFMLGSAFLFLAGCSPSPIKMSETIESEKFSTSISDMTGREAILQGRLDSSIFLSGIYHPILLSGNELIASGVWSIGLPQDLDSREYVSRQEVISKTMREWMGFTNDSKQKAATFHIQKIIRPQSEDGAKSLCKKDYMDGLLSQSERIKIIQGRTIYVSYAVLEISGLDVEPRTAEEMHFCFVEQGLLYNFSLSNYNKAYMEEIVDSLVFE